MGTGSRKARHKFCTCTCNFVLRIYSSYIITYVIAFSRSSHINDFQCFTVLVSHRPPRVPLCVHTSHRICKRESQDRVQGRLGGQPPPFAPPVATLMAYYKNVLVWIALQLATLTNSFCISYSHKKVN